MRGDLRLHLTVHETCHFGLKEMDAKLWLICRLLFGWQIKLLFSIVLSYYWEFGCQSLYSKLVAAFVLKLRSYRSGLRAMLRCRPKTKHIIHNACDRLSISVAWQCNFIPLCPHFKIFSCLSGLIKQQEKTHLNNKKKHLTSIKIQLTARKTNHNLSARTENALDKKKKHTRQREKRTHLHNTKNI